MIREGLAKL